MSVALTTFDAGDRREVERSTRVTMTMSVIVHLLLLAWLVLTRAAPAVQPKLTEVTLLDAAEAAGGEAGAGGGSAAARVEVVSPGTTAPAAHDAHFRRESRDDAGPQAQSDVALDDRIRSRLEALQQSPVLAAASSAAGGAVVVEAPSLAGVSGLGSEGGGGGDVGHSLSRGGGTGSAPSLSLSRGGGTGQAPALAVASGAFTVPPAASDAAGGTDTGARRSIAGAMLAGPIADRPVLAMVSPVYPDWAKHEGAEGTVTLYFIVRPDGTVKENVLVQKTAGFQDFDESAQVALRRWRFEPLHGGRTGEQWGTITFHFRLRDAT